MKSSEFVSMFCSSQTSTMALVFFPFPRMSISAVAVFYLLTSCYLTGKGDDAEGVASSGFVGYEDPPEIVAKALRCFNDKYIYSACEESYRLKASGNVEVPLEKTEEYCSGPCLGETHLVLDCIDGIFSNFLFYNKATLQDVRDTIHAGCGYGPQRGNFDVLEHIRAETDKAWRASNKTVIGFSFIILGLFSLFL
ncbi:uncharacterized protein LOC111436937 [Cucurbita moschata]|uniref:Uncharacterized protein LOC111436937 n=1 Tax=Cucurbita moschata TaxID=3662 RepID=A0A6J1EX17_CUCMO|nr:uncharacterized protein LOC111436937 [Cucurbita moschata]